MAQIGVAAAETQALLVPTATISRGDIVQASSLRSKDFILSDAQRSNWVSANEEAAGKEARRTLPAGKPIPLVALKAPDTVKRGKPTRAVYRTQGLEITTLLTPMQDAPSGSNIQARNAETGIVVEALVQSNGELLVVAY